MPYELFLALRYLSVRRARRGAARVTALAAASGLACGVAALVFAMALANGFRDELREKILGGTAHVTLMRADGRAIDDWRETVEKVRRVEGVAAASPTTYAGALLSGPQGTAYTILRGLDAESPRAVAEVKRTMVEGAADDLFREPAVNETDGGTQSLTSFHLTPEGPPPLPVVVGTELAARTGLARVGDEGYVVVGEKAGGGAQALSPLARRVRVVGLFRSGLYDYDNSWSYFSLALAEGAQWESLPGLSLGGENAKDEGALKTNGKVKGEGGSEDIKNKIASGAALKASVVSVEVADIYAAQGVAEKIRGALGEGWTTVDWREANRPLFAALELERRTVAVIIALIMIVAALNVTAALVLVVVERRADIAVLGALGAEPRNVMCVFIIEGALIGAAGVACGVALGLAACYLGNRFKLVSLPPDVYSLSSIPLHPHAPDVLLTALFAFMISLLATLYPARSAARVRPAEALRYE